MALDDTQPIQRVEPNPTEATHPVYPFVESRRFVLYSVAVTFAVGFVLIAVAGRIAHSIQAVRGVVWVVTWIILLGWFVFAAVWDKAVRSKAKEHRYTETQARVTVDYAPGVSQKFINRARHVFTNADQEVRWMTRHSKWELIPSVIAIVMSVTILLYLWAVIGDKHTLNLGWLQSALETAQQNSPANTDSTSKATTIQLPSGVDLHLWWVIIPLLVVVATIGCMHLIRWHTTFFVVTDRSVLPDLRLPPIFLPMMDNNELAVVLASVKVVDNVDTWLGNLLNIGGVQLSTDATELRNGTETKVQYLSRWLRWHRKLVRVIREAMSQIVIN